MGKAKNTNVYLHDCKWMCIKEGKATQLCVCVCARVRMVHDLGLKRLIVT